MLDFRARKIQTKSAPANAGTKHLGHRTGQYSRSGENKRKSGKLAERLVRYDLIILDQLGYFPFVASGGALRFHLLGKLYERASVVITKNMSLS